MSVIRKLVLQLSMGWMVQGSNPGKKLSRAALEPTQPPIHWVPVFFLGVKRPGHEVDYQPSPSAGLQMSGAVPVLLLHILMAWTGTTLSFKDIIAKLTAAACSPCVASGSVMCES